MDFSLLGGGECLSFYFHLISDQFLEVVPLVVIGNTLVLVFRKEDKKFIKYESFKDVRTIGIQQKGSEEEE